MRSVRRGVRAVLFSFLIGAGLTQVIHFDSTILTVGDDSTWYTAIDNTQSDVAEITKKRSFGYFHPNPKSIAPFQQDGKTRS